MNISETDVIINSTKKWITDVVVGCNFCPFAEREIKRGTIHFEVLNKADEKIVLEQILNSFVQLDEDNKIETTLLILSGSFTDFSEYLNLLERIDILLVKNKYEGIYQVASFHPKYLFAGTKENDPSNYTNRSPYPMLHILREDSVTKAIASYPDIDNVPKRNIAFTQEKGLAYMQQLLRNC